MDAIHGEVGRMGKPTHLATIALDAYGVQGKGTLRIARREGTSSESLIWCPENRTESEVLTSPNMNYPPIEAQEGEPPQYTYPDLPVVKTESLHDVAGAYTRRLTGPIQFVWRLLEFWHLDELEAIALLGFDAEDADHVAAILRGRQQLRGRDVRDRISHLFWIRKTLHYLFQDLEVENDWLREPHAMLDDRSPLSLLVGGSMEDLLLAKEYVDAAAGG